MNPQIINNVRRLMREDERCRNNDNWLVLRYWLKCNLGLQVRQFVHSNQSICLFDYKALTGAESITRARRKIQADGGFPPTDPEVAARRLVKQREFREWARG